jgi:hypothetical protein
VDVVQVRTCWEMGRHIVEFEQGGAEWAQYGARLLPRLAERLTTEFGKGFDYSNLRHMRAFFQAFPIWDALPAFAEGGRPPGAGVVYGRSGDPKLGYPGAGTPDRYFVL